MSALNGVEQARQPAVRSNGRGASRRPRERAIHASFIEPIEPERQPSGEASIDRRFASDLELDYLPVLDRDGRPRALVRRPRGSEHARIRIPPMIVGPGASTGRAARQAMSRGKRHRFSPLVCCDDEGRYVGLIRIERLIEALAAEEAPRHSRARQPV